MHRSKYVKMFEEEPDYVKQKKEVSIDPQIMQQIIGQEDVNEEPKKNDLSYLKVQKIWSSFRETLNDNPIQFCVLYLKYYVGMSEPQIAKMLNISQPWVRGNIKNAINTLRKKLHKVPLDKIIECPNMIRDRKKKH